MVRKFILNYEEKLYVTREMVYLYIHCSLLWTKIKMKQEKNMV